MAAHFRVLAWRIPGMGEPGGLLSMGSHRVGHDWSDLAAAAASQLEKSPHSNNGLSESKIGTSKKKKKDFQLHTLPAQSYFIEKCPF